MIRICGFIILSDHDYQEALNKAASRGHYLKRQQEGVDKANREYIRDLLNAQVGSFNLPTLSGEMDEILEKHPFDANSSGALEPLRFLPLPKDLEYLRKDFGEHL